VAANRLLSCQQIWSLLQALLVLVPVAIVGIPWLYNHWEIALILSGAVLLSPFGTIISEIFSPRQVRRPPDRPDQVC
jgi:membrane protein YdbS with pleckstrin-like domain